MSAMPEHSTGTCASGDVTLHYRRFSRFWSAYFYDNNGIRLELAMSLAGKDVSNVESVLQTEREAREELETLFDDERDVERWLKAMPLVEATKPDGGRDRGDDHNTLATSVRAKSAPE